MITDHEAQELHELIGAALELIDADEIGRQRDSRELLEPYDPVDPTVALLLRRAREIAAVLVSDLTSQ